jgi:DHA1 family tetracycline resistance protein-like MFS transporter
VSRSPLFIIFLTVFIDLLGFGIVLPLLPRYGEHFEATGLVLGLLMASFSAMQFVFAPLWGRLSDRIGRRPVLLVGLLGSTLFYFLFARVTQLGNAGPIYGLSPLAWLFITRIGAGIAGATIPTAQAYIADVTDATNRGKGMALIGFAFGMGFTFGPLIGAPFVPSAETAAPSAAPGYVAAVLSGAAFLWAAAMLPESLKTAAATHRPLWFDRSSLQAALSRPYIGPILLAVFLTTFAFAQFETTLSLLTKHLGLSDQSNFLVFAYIGLILALAQGLLVRRLIPRIGEFWMGLVGVVLMTAGLACLGWASTRESMLLVYSVLPIAVVGFASTTPSLQALLSLNTGADEQGGILGIGQSMSALARILGPALALPLQKWNLPLPYWVGAVLMAVSCGLIVSLYGAARRVTTAEAQG